MSNLLQLPLVVGKDYVTRGGWKAKVVADNLTGKYPLAVIHYRDGTADSYVTYMSANGQANSFHRDSDLIAEWVDETPVSASAGLSLLEAMRSGRDFRPVGSDTELDYLRIDRNGYVVFINGAGTTPMDDKRLTASYELRPEEPAKLLECWVVLSEGKVIDFGRTLADAEDVCTEYQECNPDSMYTVKHMREVVGE